MVNEYQGIYNNFKNPLMKPLKLICLICACCICLCFSSGANAQKAVPDTVKAGIYITSIHDIDFKDKEYSV